jgi:arylsulfatase A-like enzyme
MLVRLLLSALVLSAGPTTAADPLRPPNVLILFADDQRADTIGAWGNPHVRTPNLDRLAGRGFSFRNNYCFGSNSGAVCVPSRAMLMTGKTWLDVKHDLTGATLLPKVLREAGYTTFTTTGSR